jgi:NitT/TauT family transport system substrate-binding protein
MKTSHKFLLIVILGLTLAACESLATQPEQTAPALRKVTLGLGFIPNVQFTPFYVANEMGFYADEGLDVEIEHGFENDFVALAAQGERDFAVASGDQVILARAQGLPITYIMKWYQRYPVALILGPDQSLTVPEDLSGLKIGIPGLFGASFVGWKALVHSAGIDEAAVDLEEIGFTQAAAVQQGAVDGAIIYIANEPIQLRNQGLDVTVIEVSDYIDLVSNGLIAGDKLIAEDPDLVRKMIRASLRGLEYTLANTDESFELARRFIPEMTAEDASIQRQVLDASIELWRTDQPGFSNRQAWQDSLDFMQTSGLLADTGDLTVDEFYTNEFVESR